MNKNIPLIFTIELEKRVFDKVWNDHFFGEPDPIADRFQKYEPDPIVDRFLKI